MTTELPVTEMHISNHLRRFLFTLIAIVAGAGVYLPRAEAEGASAAYISKCEDRSQRQRYEGDYAGALATVEACLEKAPDSPDLLLVRATILHDKNDLQEALIAYRQALAAGLYGPGRRKVRKIIRDLGPVEKTRIHIEVEKGPAKIYLTSKALGVRCIADPVCTTGRLPGWVRVYIERDGFAPVKERVKIRKNHTAKVVRTLEELPSTLDIEVTPGDAKVMLDGEVLSETKAVEIAAGEHPLQVTLPGFAPHEQIISAHLGKPVSVRVTLAELIGVTVSVPEAELFLDEKPVTLEQGMLRLPPGDDRAHVVTAKAEGYLDATVEIPEKRPRQYKVALTLSRPPPPPPPPPNYDWSRTKIATVATTAGLATTGYALGTYFALSARSLWQDARSLCEPDSAVGLVCDAKGAEAVEAARDRAAWAEISLAAGTMATLGVLATVNWNAPPPEKDGMSRTRMLSMGASAGVAVAASGLGAWYGWRARAARNQARAPCLAGDPGCERRQYVLVTESHADARLANLGFAVAGVAAASTVFLWLSRPAGREENHASPAQVAPLLGAGQVGLTISGALP